MGIYCAGCEASIPGDLEVFKKHIFGCQPNPPFICTEGSCIRRKFQVSTSFYRHLRDHHNDVCFPSPDNSLEETGGQSPRLVFSSCADGFAGEAAHVSDGSDGESSSDNEVHEDTTNFDKFAIELERAAALMILNVRKHANVTSAAVSIVTKECQSLILNVIRLTKEEVSRNLKEAGIAEDDINLCVNNTKFYEPFKNLKSSEQQLKYFKQHFGLVMPEGKFLQYRLENRLDKVSGCVLPKQIKIEFQYISLIQTLTAVLNNPILFELIHSEKKSTDGKMRSYLDGSLAAVHALLNKYPFTIRLTPYTDDFEPCNAQGAKAGSNSIAGFYYAIQNLPSEENARLRSIHVSAYAYRCDLPQDRGVDVLIEPFLEELKKLECDEGVVIKVNGADYTLRATLIGFSADALAAHEVLGLCSPSAGHFCSLCYVDRPTFHQNIFAMGIPRTKELTFAQVDEIQTRGLKNVQEQYGVLRKSLLMKEPLIANFPEACVLDAMHDCLKGIVPMEIKLALHDFVIVKKLFTVPALNAKLQAFNYGPADMKNKPSANFTEDALKKKGHYTLHQSAAQTWCLLRIFPFLARSLGVPEDNEHLKMIVLLKRSCDIIFSTVTSDADIDELEKLIVEHHQAFTDLYPPPPKHNQPEDEEDVEDEDFLVEESPDDPTSDLQEQDPPNTQSRARKKPKVIRQINKHHHLLHFPGLFRKYGNIVLYWCMR